MKSIIPLSLLTFILPILQLNAAVIGLNHISVSSNIFNIDQEFSSSDGTGFRDFTGFIFTSTGASSYEYGGSFLDEGASVFLVQANDTFSEDNILGGSFVELNIGTVYNLPPVFFLGIRTPALGVGFSSFSPAYGWAEVQNPGTSNLALADHAVAYDSQGIIVNTLTAVPEPSTSILGLIAMLGLVSQRRPRS